MTQGPAKAAFFKSNPQLYIKPLGTENNTKELKSQKEKRQKGKVRRRKGKGKGDEARFNGWTEGISNIEQGISNIEEKGETPVR